MSLPVVFVHGLRTSASMWDPQIDRLAARGWRCLAPDLPGHGDRSSEQFTLDDAVATIGEALAAADGPAHLVGCSLGGMLAIHAAASTQAPLVSLVAAACSASPSPGGARAYGAAIGVFDRIGGDRAVRWALGESGARAFLRKGRAPLGVVRDAMREISTLDLLADLASVDAPVAVLNGHLDQFRGEERRFAAAARRGRLVVLPYGGHTVNLTSPDRYTDDLERILRDAERLRQ